GSWRGKKPLQRNALIALANLGGRESLPAIINCLDDPRPVIRGTAVWAITELTKRDPKETIGLFEQLQAKETDPEVLLEITEAFETFKNPRRK
ncbi:MAG TPA: HEAT repeat domain-containing protein, partial [Enterococcus aquimarinus]|nr:HEAT repeat domain-containing protein [Enterococcus aquimarinus]